MYREVTMLEITEVVRLWRDGVTKKPIAARLGLDPKTVRRYVTVADVGRPPSWPWTPTARRLGSVPSAPGTDRAVARARRAPHQDPQAANPARRAAPCAGRAAALHGWHDAVCLGACEKAPGRRGRLLHCCDSLIMSPRGLVRNVPLSLRPLGRSWIGTDSDEYD